MSDTERMTPAGRRMFPPGHDSGVKSFAPAQRSLRYRPGVLDSVGMGMRYSDDDLNDVSDKNDGYCWHCGTTLAVSIYGNLGQKAAGAVDPANALGVDDLRHWSTARIPR